MEEDASYLAVYDLSALRQQWPVLVISVGTGRIAQDVQEEVLRSPDGLMYRLDMFLHLYVCQIII